jgi:hypothetical protein
LYYGVRKDLFLNLLISEFEFFCFQSKWQKENAASKSRINTKFYNKNTIESELGDSNFNGVFKKDAMLFFAIGLEPTLFKFLQTNSSYILKYYHSSTHNKTRDIADKFFIT